MNIKKTIVSGVLGILIFADCSGMNNFASSESDNQQDWRPVVNMEYYPARMAIIKDVPFFRTLFMENHMADGTQMEWRVIEDESEGKLWECNAWKTSTGGLTTFLTVYLRLKGAADEIFETAEKGEVDIDMASTLPIICLEYGTGEQLYRRYPTNKEQVYEDLREQIDFHIPLFVLRHIYRDDFDIVREF